MIKTFIMGVILGLLSLHPKGEEPYEGAELDLNTRGSSHSAAYSQSTGDIFVLDRSTHELYKIGMDGSVEILDALEDEPSNRRRMEITTSGDALLFWDNGVGRVFRYDIESGELSRIDTSRDHRTMFGHAATVTDGGYIYAIGGYGYWELRNFLIRFEPESGQWERVEVGNTDQIIRSRDGLLFQIGNTFYYLVEEYGGTSRHSPYVYKLDLELSVWNRVYDTERLLAGFSISASTSGNYQFRHEVTNRVDRETEKLGYLSRDTGTSHLNLLNLAENSHYRVDLSHLNIYDARAVFFSEKLNRWLILGHPQAPQPRSSLRVYIYEHDPEAHFVEVTVAGKYLPASVIAIGFIVIITGGLMLIVLFRNQESEVAEDEPGTGSASKPIVIQDNEEELTVTINGGRIPTSRDASMKKLWLVIAEMVKSDNESILISDLDQKIFPNQTQQSNNSRRRKKLFGLINDMCGFDFIREERSKVDKRYKVLLVDLSRVLLEV